MHPEYILRLRLSLPIFDVVKCLNYVLFSYEWEIFKGLSFNSVISWYGKGRFWNELKHKHERENWKNFAWLHFRGLTKKNCISTFSFPEFCTMMTSNVAKEKSMLIMCYPKVRKSLCHQFQIYIRNAFCVCHSCRLQSL